ncbi:MAG TPA: SRPBCC domain-containing protein [Candidatus Saccharimonadales bacterium]|nr:SRPBCC domain-containing protein [Candidatus Saccharimonadales bacterium]
MLTVEATVNAPIEAVWRCWTSPEHITGWAFASDDWEASEAENDLRAGGSFKTRMQAKDGSNGFDMTGTYSVVKQPELIEYVMDDGRHVRIEFESVVDGTRVTEQFEPENENSESFQVKGWQAILDNFKKYTEGQKGLVR